jgi:L-rhamnose mutarotase
MIRYGGMIKIKAENFQEYQELHEVVWPEVSKAFI